MPKINFQELLQEAVKAKSKLQKGSQYQESKLLDLAIIGLGCASVLENITSNCYPAKESLNFPLPQEAKS